MRYGLLIATLMLCVLPGCSAPVRSLTTEQLEADRPRYVAQVRKEYSDAVLKLVRRMKAEQDEFVAGKRKTPPTCDVLIISGGADYGAFGAGVLEGWGEVNDPDLGRPEFDLVSGVSTGALIAPFAFIGDRNAYHRAFQLYQEPKDGWIRKRGLLFFLPHYPSLLDIDELKADIRKTFSRDVVEQIALASKRGQVLRISATNLDYGQRRVWDVAALAEKLAADKKSDLTPLHNILLASSAIPGAFPPVEIGGHLYVDGATTANILYEQEMRSPDAPIAVWKRLCPGIKPPRTRYWVIVNNQLVAPPHLTPQTWVGVVEQSLTTSVRASTMTSIEHLASELALLRASGEVDTEFRVIAIPPTWRPPKEGIFVKETMESLAKLGREMGRNLNSWKQDTLLDDAPLPVTRPAATAPASK